MSFDIYEAVSEIVGDSGRVIKNAPMKDYTTFKTGGPAEVLVEAAHAAEIARLIDLCRRESVPFTVLGNGSNVLVRDEGLKGLVIHIGSGFEEISIDEENATITAGAGAMLSVTASKAAGAALSGMEFASGIPGSIGGAVFMNAGAYGGEMADIVVGVRALMPDGEEKEFDEFDFSYRHSIFCENRGIVTAVTLKLEKGDEEEIRAKMRELNKRRVDKQPLNFPSAGSTFKRPEGYFAGKLIEDAGCKGLSVGGAQVSPKHAGFIVNTGNATSQDILDLIALVQLRVKECSGVDLETEVRIL